MTFGTYQMMDVDRSSSQSPDPKVHKLVIILWKCLYDYQDNNIPSHFIKHHALKLIKSENSVVHLKFMLLQFFFSDLGTSSSCFDIWDNDDRSHSFYTPWGRNMYKHETKNTS